MAHSRSIGIEQRVIRLPNNNLTNSVHTDERRLLPSVTKTTSETENVSSEAIPILKKQQVIDSIEKRLDLLLNEKLRLLI